MWQHVDVAKRPRDPNQLAKLIVDIATGEAEDAVSESKRHPEALRGRSGGIMGGKSKKAENHAAAVALHFVHYNFARVHKTYGSPNPDTIDSLMRLPKTSSPLRFNSVPVTVVAPPVTRARLLRARR